MLFFFANNNALTTLQIANHLQITLTVKRLISVSYLIKLIQQYTHLKHLLLLTILYYKQFETRL